VLKPRRRERMRQAHPLGTRGSSVFVALQVVHCAAYALGLLHVKVFSLIQISTISTVEK